jgi:hypothetical protein
LWTFERDDPRRDKSQFWVYMIPTNPENLTHVQEYSLAGMSGQIPETTKTITFQEAKAGKFVNFVIL